MAANAPYYYNGSKWIDSNSNLAIRGSSNMSNPTTKNVPVIKSYVSSKWSQIYPPQEESVKPPDKPTKDLIMWQGNSDSDSQVWGWAYGSNGNTVAACGYFGDGPKNNENNIKKQYCGWLGLDQGRLIEDGYKVGKVTKVTKIEIWVTHKPGTGVPSYVRHFGLIGSNVASPRASNLNGQRGDAYNPCIQKNRSAIVESDNKTSFSPGGTVKYTFTSKSACDLFKKFLNGDWKAIFSFNGSGKGDATIYQGGGRYELTSDYQKITDFKYKIDYAYEP